MCDEVLKDADFRKARGVFFIGLGLKEGVSVRTDTVTCLFCRVRASYGGLYFFRVREVS